MLGSAAALLVAGSAAVVKGPRGKRSREPPFVQPDRSCFRPELAESQLMKNSLDVAVSALVTAAIVAMAVVLLHREFASSDRTSHLDDQLPPPTFVPEWRELLGSGVRLGDASAPITIVEFADLQCPACRAFHRELQTVLDRWKRKVSVVFVHYPLSNHPSARAAARALECARDQGAFSEYWVSPKAS